MIASNCKLVSFFTKSLKKDFNSKIVISQDVISVSSFVAGNSVYQVSFYKICPFRSGKYELMIGLV